MGTNQCQRSIPIMIIRFRPSCGECLTEIEVRCESVADDVLGHLHLRL